MDQDLGSTIQQDPIKVKLQQERETSKNDARGSSISGGGNENGVNEADNPNAISGTPSVSPLTPKQR